MGPYSVEAETRWTKQKAGAKGELWTVDGFDLESLRFVNGLADGEAFIEPDAREGAAPAFRSSMAEAEIADLVVNSLARLGAGNVTTDGLEPARFGSRDGFRFTLRFLTREGLEMQGTACGMVADGQLYLIVYSAERSHYYDKYAPQIERMLSTIQTG
jgi:hypothetical protein